MHPVVAREILSTILGGIDLNDFDFDGPLPPLEPNSNGSQSTFLSITNIAKRDGLSIRQLAYRVAGARAKMVIKGTPPQVADHMEHWFREGAADGFNIMPPHLPGAFRDFVELVVPELQRRGLSRTEYTGKTLRDHAHDGTQKMSRSCPYLQKYQWPLKNVLDSLRPPGQNGIDLWDEDGHGPLGGLLSVNSACLATGGSTSCE
jgi:hypothetical protein